LDNGIPLSDDLLLEVRENDPLAQAMHCHGPGEAGKFRRKAKPADTYPRLILCKSETITSNPPVENPTKSNPKQKKSGNNAAPGHFFKIRFPKTYYL